MLPTYDAAVLYDTATYTYDQATDPPPTADTPGGSYQRRKDQQEHTLATLPELHRGAVTGSTLCTGSATGTPQLRSCTGGWALTTGRATGRPCHHGSALHSTRAASRARALTPGRTISATHPAGNASGRKSYRRTQTNDDELLLLL